MVDNRMSPRIPLRFQSDTDGGDGRLAGVEERWHRVQWRAQNRDRSEERPESELERVSARAPLQLRSSLGYGTGLFRGGNRHEGLARFETAPRARR
jgi:hypothetical protein